MERRCKNPKPAASEEQRCVVHDVPDDLLRLILLRLDSPLWLVRAACACKRWRRIVDGGDGSRSFLRLARSLHPPVVVGRYHNYLGYRRRFVPSSPTPIRLSSPLDFFPQEFVQRHHAIYDWHVADCHGGLVLLRDGSGVASDLVVCNPLSRLYRDIHHPPHRPTTGCYLPRVFLLDCGDDDGNISISNFRVLYCSDCSSDHHDSLCKVYVFSTADGGGWRLVRQSIAAFDDDLFHSYMGQIIGRIDRSLYIATSAGSVKVLDNAGRLEFSEVDLPSRVRKSSLHSDYSAFAVVHGASPKPIVSPATASIIHMHGEYLELFRRIPSSGGWVLEHSIPRLSEATHGLQGYPEPSRWKAVDVIAGGTRFAVLKVSLACGYMRSWLLSLDVDTMQLQVVPDVAAYHPLDMQPKIYTLPWPQFLTALPS